MKNTKVVGTSLLGALLLSLNSGFGAVNCPNGESLFDYERTDFSANIYSSGGNWYFTITGTFRVELNCDRSPCWIRIPAGISILGDDSLLAWEGSSYGIPADPWCDDGDVRIITNSGSGGSASREPRHVFFYFSGRPVSYKKIEE